MAMHEPEARIQCAEPDDDVSLGRHVDHVLNRRVTQVQSRAYVIAPVRMRAVLIGASDVVIVVGPSACRGVEFRVADTNDGKAVPVHVDWVVGEEFPRAVVEQD